MFLNSLKHMKKILLVFFLLVMLSGCDTSFENDEDDSQPENNEETNDQNDEKAKEDNESSDEYEVVFKDYDGNVMSVVTVDEGDDVDAPNIPEVKGYYFTGWNESLNSIESDMIVSPTYEPNTYTIQYKTGNSNIENFEEEITYGGDIDLPDIVDNSYGLFDGWEYDGHILEEQKKYTWDKDISVEAQWIDFEDLYDYEYLDEGIKITDYKGDQSKLVIPDKLNGEPVISILSGAFSGANDIKTIETNVSLKSIGRGSFSDMDYLEKIVINKNVDSIDSEAFDETPKLKHIDVVEENQHYTSDEGVLFKINQNTLSTRSEGFISKLSTRETSDVSTINGAVLQRYPVGRDAESYTVPEGIVEIGWGAFSGARLKNIEFPSSLEVIGGYAFSRAEQLTEITIPSNVKRLGSPHPDYSFDVFEGNVFYNAKSLEKIIFEEGSQLKTIEYNILQGTESIESITIPASVKYADEAFLSSKSLINIYVENGNANYVSRDGVLFSSDMSTLYIYPKAREDIEYTIPSGTEILHRQSFRSASNLEKINLPDSLIEIEAHVFEGVNSVSTIHVPENLRYIGGHAFHEMERLEEFTISENNDYLKVKDSVLYNQEETIVYKHPSTLDRVQYTLPDSVETIKSGAFYDLKSLESINLSSNLKWIGIEAFKNAVSLKEITFPESLETVGSSAFENAETLESITIPENVENIAFGDAFEGTKSLIKIDIAENHPNYTSKNGIVYNKDETVIVKVPENHPDTNLVMTEGIIEIQERAFLNNNNLQSITVADSLQSIGGMAFKNAKSLEEIHFAEEGSLNKIAHSVFVDAGSLKELRFPSSLESISNSLVVGAESLEAVYIPKSVNSVGTTAFSKVPAATIYIEHESRPEGWQNNWIDRQSNVIWNYEMN